jgi:general secretion pathway protein J
MYNSCRGFTLLELVISIAIMGLIIVIIIGAMRLGSRSIESGERKIKVLERMRASMNIVDSQIQSQIPLTYEENGERKYYFRGEREFMQFATNYSVWGGERGYVVATYSVKTGDSGRQILVVSESVIGLEGSRDATLFDSFQNVFFEYYSKEPAEEEGKWVEQWTDGDRIPEKVRVHLVNDASDFSLIIPMRVYQSSAGRDEADIDDNEE